MKFNLKINDLKSITEIPGYWTNEDFMNLLEAFDFSDSNEENPAELRELLEMAISDLDPQESAEILLTYKLGEKLSKGQIQNLSNEMMEDNESEEYPDISMHLPLFAINRMLYKAYNGIFPNAKATKIEFEIRFTEKANLNITRELVLLALSKILKKQNPIIRLYEKELSGKKRFHDAENIIWILEKNENNIFTLITSEYWLNKEDFIEDEITGSIMLFEEIK